MVHFSFFSHVSHIFQAYSLQWNLFTFFQLERFKYFLVKKFSVNNIPVVAHGE